MKIRVTHYDLKKPNALLYELDEPTVVQVCCHLSAEQLFIGNEVFKVHHRLYCNEKAILVVFVDRCLTSLGEREILT